MASEANKPLGILPRPRIIHPMKLSECLNYLIKNPSTGTTIIICMPRHVFMEQAVQSLTATEPFLLPTLHLLSTTNDITVHFCSTLPALLAFLGTYPHSEGSSPSAGSTLALLYLARAHANTASESVQGFSRSLASVVEASIRARQRLVVIEPATIDPDAKPLPSEFEANPWDHQLPILNVTSSRFGVGERGWVGRTVPLRRVVGRWFTFESPVG